MVIESRIAQLWFEPGPGYIMAIVYDLLPKLAYDIASLLISYFQSVALATKVTK